MTTNTMTTKNQCCERCRPKNDKLLDYPCSDCKCHQSNSVVEDSDFNELETAIINIVYAHATNHSQFEEQVRSNLTSLQQTAYEKGKQDVLKKRSVGVNVDGYSF